MLYALAVGYAILRVQKLKHTASIRRSLKHAFREQDTPNADPDRTPDNTHVGAASVDEAMAKVADLLPEKRRSDAVLAIEYLVTGSPEAMAAMTPQQQDAYLRQSLDWIRERHGAANVVYAGIHRDETTPHLYAYAVPLDADTGRLNAKRWLGGAKALTEMQTEFAERVGKAHGLQRGIEGSKATHQRVRQHYAELTKPAPERVQGFSAADVEPKVLRKGLLSSEVEAPETVARRLNAELSQRIAPLAARSRAYDAEKRKREDAERTAKAANAEAAKLRQWAAPFLDVAKISADAAKAAHAKLRQWAEDTREKTAKAQQEREQAARLAKGTGTGSKAMDALRARSRPSPGQEPDEPSKGPGMGR